jgi:ABC-type branched-subunit amino acid transport system ATPase component
MPEMRDDVTNILEVNGVSGGYGKVPILHGIEFTVAENEVVGVLGHNGMGKTTLLKTLMGFLPSSAGTIRFDSTDITAMVWAWAMCHRAVEFSPNCPSGTIYALHGMNTLALRNVMSWMPC